MNVCGHGESGVDTVQEIGAGEDSSQGKPSDPTTVPPTRVCAV